MPELVAWRLFQHCAEGTSGLMLKSIVYRNKWAGPVLQAICPFKGIRPPHEPPGKLWCECGIWAVRERPTQLKDERGNFYLLQPPSMAFFGSVCGKVALFGKVIIGEQGYRANRVAIRELWTAVPGTAELLANRYQCEVHDTSAGEDEDFLVDVDNDENLFD